MEPCFLKGCSRSRRQPHPGKPVLPPAGWLHPRAGHTMLMLMLMGWLWACYLEAWVFANGFMGPMFTILSGKQGCERLSHAEQED